MRFLILILAGVAIWLILRHYWQEPQAAPPARIPQHGKEQAEQKSLTQVLEDASTFFAEARAQTDPAQRALADAIGALREHCDTLKERVSGDDGFARSLRQPILRLLLPLNGVVRRAARASHRTPSEERDSLLSASADAIARSAHQLGRLTERADEAALRRLEIDLEVLEGRLSEAE